MITTAPLPEQPSTVICSLSGGNDGFAAALLARARWPDARCIVWHAHLAGMDWRETHAVLVGQAAHLRAELVIVQAVYGLTGEQTPTGANATTLLALHDVLAQGEAIAAQYGPEAIFDLLAFAERARGGQPPTSAIRWCTSYFKTQLFDAWARRERASLGDAAVLVSGERWPESVNRSKVAAWEWRKALTLKPNARTGSPGWRLLWWRPAIRLPWHAVNQCVLASGVPFHPGYFAQGETVESMCDPARDERKGRARLSCRICIYTRPQEMAHALLHAPELFSDAVEAVAGYEARSGYTWQRRGPIRELVKPKSPIQIIPLTLVQRSLWDAA